MLSIDCLARLVLLIIGVSNKSLLVLSAASQQQIQAGFPRDSESCDVPRWCYSCASKKFGRDWDSYKLYFHAPVNFTDSCDPKMNFKRLPLIQCRAPCLTLVEPIFLFGKEVSKIYYRGCMENFFKAKEVDNTAVEYLMHSGDSCRTVPRNILFNQQKLPADNITLCSCVCDKCNIFPERSNDSSISNTRGVVKLTLYISLCFVYIHRNL